MKREDAEEFTQSLGQIVGGSWRQIALAKKLGVPKALGLSVDEWVHQRLGGYVRLSINDRREAVEELSDEGLSNRAIGEVLGVDESTVREDKGAGNPAPEPIDKSQVIELEGQVSEPELLAAGNPAPEPISAVALLAADEKLRTAAKIEERRVENAAKRAEIAAAKVAMPTTGYHCIVIDPPWPMEKIERDVRPNQAGFDYPTMSEDELAAFELPAADDCHLFCCRP